MRQELRERGGIKERTGTVRRVEMRGRVMHYRQMEVPWRRADTPVGGYPPIFMSVPARPLHWLFCVRKKLKRANWMRGQFTNCDHHGNRDRAHTAHMTATRKRGNNHTKKTERGLSIVFLLCNGVSPSQTPISHCLAVIQAQGSTTWVIKQSDTEVVFKDKSASP